MTLTPQLSEAIEELYAKFASYPLPEDTEPCWHCHTKEDEAKVHAKPLRELECEHLMGYAWDALLVWGNEQTFRHFLPRIFELLVISPEFRGIYAEPEIVLNRLRYGHWRDWPATEQQVIERYLHALLDWVLCEPPPEDSFPNIESWLCAIGNCEDNLMQYLNQWIADERPSAAFALSSFLLSSAVTHKRTQGRDSFWDQRDAQYEQVQRWVKSPEVICKLADAEVAHAGSELAQEFAAAKLMCEGD